MIFASKIQGIPCKVRVLSYIPEVPSQIWGPPERCYPTEPEELELEILDRKGYQAKWLERKAQKQDWENLTEEFHIMREGELHEPY